MCLVVIALIKTVIEPIPLTKKAREIGSTAQTILVGGIDVAMKA